MRTALAILLVVSASSLAASQRDASPVDAYLDLVRRYHSGEEVAVVTELSRWAIEDLERAVRALPRTLHIRTLRATESGTTVSEKAEIGQATVVATAMVAHAHVARRADSADDGERHLAIGLRLSELLPPTEPSNGFRARWHLVAGTVIFGFSNPAKALHQFEMARRLRPADPAILLAAGSAHETEGSILARHSSAQRPAPTKQLRGTRQKTARERLHEAAELYRAVLASTPDSHEARLRLARTQYLMGQVDGAAADVAVPPHSISDPYLRYLTLLIGGSIHEAAGRLDDAIVKYREARSLCNGCHSATLALSQALLRAGDRDTAYDLVDRLVNVTLLPPRSDPWWVYQLGQWQFIDAMLDQLRREVPQ